MLNVQDLAIHEAVQPLVEVGVFPFSRTRRSSARRPALDIPMRLNSQVVFRHQDEQAVQ
jgi:hypothetical protein